MTDYARAGGETAGRETGERRQKKRRMAQAVIDPAGFPTGTRSDSDKAIPIPSIRKYQPLMITYWFIPDAIRDCPPARRDRNDK